MQQANPTKAGDDSAADRLESWKEVAAYLKRDVRTAQRWERTEGLPVHRHQHGERGSVYAFRHELDGWRTAREAKGSSPEAPPQERRQWRLLAAAALVVIIAGAATVLVLRRDQPPKPAVTPAVPSFAVWDPPRLLSELTRERGHVEWVTVGRGTHRLAITPDGKELYVTSISGAVSVVDTARKVVTRNIAAAHPISMAVNREGTRVYVAQEHGDVLVIDTRTKATSRIVTRTHARDIALTPDGRTLFIAAVYGGLLAADTATGEVRRVSALPCPDQVALSPDGRRLFVSYECSGPGGRRGHDAIDILDVETRSSAGVIAGPPNVGGDIGTTPDGAQLWIDGRDACLASQYDHTGCPALGPVVNVFRLSDRTLLRTLTPGAANNAGTQLSFVPDSSRVVTAGGISVDVYNTATLTPTESASLYVSGNVVFSPDQQTTYVPIGDDQVAVVLLPRRPAPPAGLSGRWTADGTANDTVGVQHGIVDEGVTFRPGVVGQAFAFEPPRAALRISGPSNLSIIHHPFSLLFFVKFNSIQGEVTLADRLVRTRDAPRGWRLIKSSDHRLTATFGDSWLTGNTTMDAARWYHVALVWNGQTATLYVDGRVDAQRKLQFFDDDGEPLRFGAGLSGLLDEIETYERALGPNEIAGWRGL